jgi:hypothetical protein
MAWIVAWLSVNITARLFGGRITGGILSIIYSARASPFSSAAYTVDIHDIPIYCIRLV